MVRPMLRSRGLARVKRGTPGGETRTLYERRRRSPAVCARCRRILGGVPRDAADLRRLPKSSKRPNRIFGGHLCHACTEEILKQAVRSAS